MRWATVGDVGSGGGEERDQQEQSRRAQLVKRLSGLLGRERESSKALAGAAAAAVDRERLSTASHLLPDFAEPAQGTKRPLVSRLVAVAVKRWLESNTVSTSNITVDVVAERNRHVLVGKLLSLRINFDQLVLKSLSASGGSVITLLGVDFRYLRLLTRTVKPVRRPLQALCDCTFTAEDVRQSKLVQRLMESLVNTILSRLLLFKFATPGAVAQVERVDLDGHRVKVAGTVASALSNVSIGFAVSFGLSLRAAGHTVVVDDLCTVLNPGDPFLETAFPDVSLGFIDIDIGENARIDRLEITSSHVRLTGWSKLSPAPPFQVSYPLKRAFYTFDLGAMLSTLACVST